MKVLKWPNPNNSKNPFRIKSKCPCCGCKTEIEDSFDMCFIRGYESFYSKPTVYFGYYCPSCGGLVELSEFANRKILKTISKNGAVNINEYIRTSSDINFKCEIGSEHSEQIISKIYEMLEKGLPIPIQSKAFMRMEIL